MQESSDWQWQVRNSIRSVEELKEYVNLSHKEEEEIREAEAEFSWQITPYYAQLMDRKDTNCPIRKQSIPNNIELHDPLGTLDPLDEEKHNPAPNVIKVYPDRIAWCVSNVCPVLCRHCLRKRMVGRENFDITREARNAALTYIEKTSDIRDVLVTGGDPLMYSDDFVEEIVSRLYAIDHVEIIRIKKKDCDCVVYQRE